MEHRNERRSLKPKTTTLAIGGPSVTETPSPASPPIQWTSGKGKVVSSKLWPEHLAKLDRIAKRLDGPKPGNSAMIRWIIETWEE